MIFLSIENSFWNGKMTRNLVEDCFLENNQLAIYMDKNGNTSIIQSNFSNNFADNGGSIYLSTSQQSNSSLQIINCVFLKNNGTLSGGALFLKMIGKISIIQSNFSKNIASTGAAFILYTSQSNSLVEIVDCVFTENKAISNGGALYLKILGNLSIIRSHFLNHLAYNGGAILFASPQPNYLLTIVDCVFTRNNATYSGGAINMEKYGNVSIIRSKFSNNFAAWYGGAFGLSTSLSNSLIEIVDCVFIENNCTNNGGAFYIKIGGKTTIIRSNYSNNFSPYGGAFQLINPQLNSLTKMIDCFFKEDNSINSGGVIYMEKAGNTSIIRSVFSNNFASIGGAIMLLSSLSNSLLEIVECAFEENNSTSAGGAIYLKTIGNTSIIRTNFSNNLASSNGGALFVITSQLNSLLEIIDCVFLENNSTNSGGAIYLKWVGNTSLIRNNFSNNLASYCGAIDITASLVNSLIEIMNCFFRENNSTNYGGAIYMEKSGNTSIKKSSFSNNLVFINGAAIHLFASLSNSLIEIIDCVFMDNNSTSLGGAVYLKMIGNISIIRGYFSNNFAYNGGAIISFASQSNSLLEISNCVFIENNSTNFGGAIYMENYGNNTIINSKFSNNFASYGGVIYLISSQSNNLFEIVDCDFSENNSSNYGGTFYMEKFGSSTLTKNNFSKNLASHGGSLYLLTSQSNSLLEIIECVFIENDSKNYGGAIYLNMIGNTSINRSNFSNNFASYGGTIYCLTSNTNSLLEIVDSVFINNNSTNSGSAIYLENYGNTSLIKNNFQNNVASSNGSAIYLLIAQVNSLLEIIDCVFIQNNSTNSGGAIYMKMIGNTSLIRSNFSNNFASYGGALYSWNQKCNFLYIFFLLGVRYFSKNNIIIFLFLFLCNCRFHF